ncbi:hypothetical protein AA0229_1796 [Gluconobacter cerinus NRIC 0229]|nr:hypothetical protein AA0229_1796 [Gluconobacter cerinus NRIC 0229]
MAFPEGAQFHRAIRQRTEPESNIDAFLYEIDPFVVQVEFNTDTRMLVLKSEDQLADMKDSQSCRA